MCSYIRSCDPLFVCTLSDSGTLLLLLILMIAISTHTDLKGLNAALQQPALCAINIAVAFLLLVIACYYVLVVYAIWRVAVEVTKMVVHGV